MIRFVYMNENNLEYYHVDSMETISLLHPEIDVNECLIISDDLFDSIDKTFMHAYEINNGQLIFNTEKAKNIQKDILRRDRKPLFEKLDYQFMMALESGDEDLRQTVINQKQFLRDVTNQVDTANSLESIKNVSVKNISSIVCIGEDLQAAGLCVTGAKEWFEQHNLDFKSFIKNGILSDEFIATNDPKALTVVEAAYKRLNF